MNHYKPAMVAMQCRTNIGRNLIAPVCVRLGNTTTHQVVHYGLPVHNARDAHVKVTTNMVRTPTSTHHFLIL